MRHANKVYSVQCPSLCRVIYLYFLAFFVDIFLNFFHVILIGPILGFSIE